MISFVVPGQPQAKGRPRLSTRGGFARAYTPAKTVAYEGLIALSGQEAMAGRAPMDGPVSVAITATFQIPKSWSKRQRAAAETGHLAHTGKPDLDNIAKAVGDGLNGIVWADDSQVARLTMDKRYGAAPGLCIAVEPLS